MSPLEQRLTFYFDTIDRIIKSFSWTDWNEQSWPTLLNIRSQLFFLEGLFRIISKLEKEAEAKQGLMQVKQIEDALGQVDFFLAIRESVLKLNPQENFLQELQNSIEKSKQEAEKSFRVWGELYPNYEKYLNFHLLRLEGKKQLKHIAKFMRKACKKIQSKYKNKEYDFTSPEDGIHELRRNLRWISIYMGALSGYSALNKKPIPKKWEGLITDDIIHSKYNQFEDPVGRYAIYVDSPEFYFLSYLILQLGEYKDKLLLLEFLHHSKQEKMLHAYEKQVGQYEAILKEGNQFAIGIFKKWQFPKKLKKAIRLKKC